MPTPADLRAQSRLYVQMAAKEPTLEIKRGLASHAFALAQLAQMIEREEAERANRSDYDSALMVDSEPMGALAAR